MPLIPVVYSLGLWWPYMGDLHEDPDLNALGPHVHLDPRYATDQHLALLMRDSRDLFRGLQDPWSGVLYFAMPAFPHDLGGVMELEQLRPMPVHPRGFQSERAHIWWARWDGTPPRCGRCPHRGFPLPEMPTDAAGRKVCPMHGLIFKREDS